MLTQINKMCQELLHLERGHVLKGDVQGFVGWGKKGELSCVSRKAEEMGLVTLLLVFLVLKAAGMSSLVFSVFARRPLGGLAGCVV